MFVCLSKQISDKNFSSVWLEMMIWCRNGWIEVWWHQKWYQAQSWVKNFGCLEVDISYTSRVHSSNWRVRRAKSPLICSLTATCVKVLELWIFSFDIFRWTSVHDFLSTTVMAHFAFVWRLIAFLVSKFYVVGGMKHSSFNTWILFRYIYFFNVFTKIVIFYRVFKNYWWKAMNLNLCENWSGSKCQHFLNM